MPHPVQLHNIRTSHDVETDCSPEIVLFVLELCRAGRSVAYTDSKAIPNLYICATSLLSLVCSHGLGS